MKWAFSSWLSGLIRSLLLSCSIQLMCWHSWFQYFTLPTLYLYVCLHSITSLAITRRALKLLCNCLAHFCFYLTRFIATAGAVHVIVAIRLMVRATSVGCKHLVCAFSVLSKDPHLTGAVYMWDVCAIDSRWALYSSLMWFSLCTVHEEEWMFNTVVLLVFQYWIFSFNFYVHFN